MDPAGSVFGDALSTRRFRIGSTVVAGQVLCVDGTTARIAEVLDPASINDYTEMVGITMEAGTYSTTQGTGASSAEVLVRSTWNPFQIIKGKCSGGTTRNTAFAEIVDGNLLTNTSASAGGTLISDTDVGKSEFLTGYMIALTGQNAGQRRIISAHTDDVSETVTVPFDYAIAVGDTFFRSYAPFNPSGGGVELVATTFDQFNIKLGTTVDLANDGGGNAIVIEVELDVKDQGTVTAPVCHYYWVCNDHILNSLT